MLTQTKEVRDAWRASQRTLDIKVAVNGKTYTATDINSLKYDSGAYTGDTFAIGSTYSNNVQIEFSHLVEGLKLGMEVHPSIGIKTSKGYIYEPLGIFIISSEIKMDRNNNLTSISASDRFCGLEGTYKSKLVYPAKVLDIVAEICAQSGVKANADDLARLPHQADIPIPISGQSYRKALGWIAQLYAGYATFDRQGLFTIRTIAEPNYELDPSQYEQAGLTKNEAPYKIGGIQCQTVITTKTRDGENTEETKTYQVGDTSGSQIKLENNIMTPDRLNNIWEQIKDISFYPFNLNWFGNPAIEAGDWLRLEDKQGNKFIVPNNSYTLDFNGGLSATSKADQTSSTDSAISWRGTYAQIIEELQARKAPDGTVIFPPSVAEPPKNAKPNDVWFKQNGNSTELWVFTAQEDGSGKWIRRDLTPDEIKKQVQEAQNGLNDAKKQIADNLAKADGDIAELNASIRDQKKAFDTDIDELNASIRDQKKAFDTDIDELNKSISDQKGSLDGLSTTVNTVVIPKVTDVTNEVSDTITKVNEQKNIVTELQNQANQQGKDISKITTDVHGVTADLANLNGDVNQTKATVQGLQSTLGNAQGDIAQIKVDAKKLETSLSGKVDNSTYANFVSATNNALNAKLVASDLNGYAKTTDVQATANGLQVNINSVADRMNNLKIGAENLLTNTGDLKDYQTNNYGQIQDIVKSNYIPLILNHPELTHMGHIWTDWQSVYSNQEVILEKDKPYWFGFYVCTDRFDGNPFGKIYILGVKKGSDLSNSKVFVEQNIENYSYFGGAAKHWVWHTYKIIGDDEIYSCIRVEGNKSTGGSAYIAGYTLVQSDVAPTGHISSLEDTKHELSQLSAQITANNQKFSSYYTKVETDSKANTAKNDAISAIKNDGNWHGLTNILTNSGFLQTSDGFTQKVQQTTQPMINSANSGGVNLLVNTYNFGGFYSSAVDANGKNELSLDEKDGYYQDRNYSYIRTKVAHVWGSNFRNAPLYFNQKIYLPAGTYTLSFLARTNGNNSNNANRISLFTSYTDEHGGQQLGDSDYVHDFWEKHQITFSINQNYLHNNIRLQKWNEASLPGGSIYFANLKLESGSLATTWCPAPEDYATQTSFSELNQTIKGLQSTVSSNYTNLQSQLSQTAGTIRTEVTDKTNKLQTQITQSANDFNIKLQNSASGGGVNLLANTLDFSGFYSSAVDANGKNELSLDEKDGYYQDRNYSYIRTKVAHVWGSNFRNAPLYFNQKIYLPAGTYTLSFLARTNGNNSNNANRISLFTSYTDEHGGQQLGDSDYVHDFWEKHQITFSINQNYLHNNIRLQKWNEASLPGGSIYFANLKLESGSLATTWCPAPEDYATQTSFSELNQTVKGLQSTVSNNYTNLQSQISQTAGTIRGEVTNSVSGLQTQITQQANSFNVSLSALRSETAWQKVTTAIDANNYTTTGNYWIQAVPNSNTPDGSAWAYLQVVAYPDVQRIKQTWQRDNNANEAYTRLKTGNDWSDWQKTVTAGNIMAQINVAAGTTLIQNDKIYMDASSTVFSGKAFIPDAAITNISADKINTGTLDAGRINVINLNANNITTGTINGANLKINLNSGEILFQKGRIGSTNGNLNIDIDSGKMSVTDYWHDGFYFEDGKLYLSDNFALKTNWEPKYGVIRRSLNPFTVGESGIEIASPTGVSLQTMNYDGSFGGGDLGDQTKNGASVAIDKNGQALINGKQVGLVGGTFFDTDQNFLQRRPRIVVGTDAANSGLLPWGWGDPLNHVASRIVIDASYVHFPHSYKTTTGSAPNVFIASDGALVRSTSASKYKTEIKRSYSTEYGEKLLNLPTAIWTDKGQKERYEAGKRHIKPEKYFGMIAEDLADAGLDLLVSRNPLTHEIEGIQYERIAPALLPVIKKLKDKVDKLEEKINE